MFKSMRRSLVHVLPLAVLVASPAAEASVSLGVGADGWLNRGGEFNVTVALHASLAHAISVGGRFGALVVTNPAVAGVPLDLQLRVAVDRVYFEGSAGPWILFTDTPFRFHGAFGFGLQSGIVSFGAEVGWLDPNALLGVRLGIRL
jgi:hypothetical protein